MQLEDLVKKVAVIKMDTRTQLIILAASLSFLGLAFIQIIFMPKPLRPGLCCESTEIDLLPVFALMLITITVHEILHLIGFKLLKVDLAKVELIKMFKVIPLGIMIVYREISIVEYIIVALLPQVLTIAFLAVFLHAVANTDIVLIIISYTLYALHLGASGGDLCGVAYTLFKAKSLKGKWVSIIKEGKCTEFHLYVE